MHTRLALIMSVTISCISCGRDIDIPRGYARPRIRCRECGGLCDLGSAAGPWSVTAEPRPSNEAVAGGEDAYAIPPDAQRQVPCPKCQRSIPHDAVVCSHCGYNADTGETFERTFEEVDKQWETGLRLETRTRLFCVVVGLAAASTVIVGVVDGGWITLLVSLAIGVVLLAYVLGTYPRIHLTRNWKGRVRLRKTWRIGFYPLAAEEIRWSTYEGVMVGRSRESDFYDWAMFLILLPWGLVPAIVWWMYMIYPGQFDAALCKGHGFPELILYHGPNEALAKEIAAALREVTRLS